MSDTHITHILDEAPLASLSESELESIRAHTASCTDCAQAFASAQLSQVLLTDTNPAVRMQVVDLLVAHRDDSVVGVLQGLVQREDNNYVRLKLEKALSKGVSNGVIAAATCPVLTVRGRDL